MIKIYPIIGASTPAAMVSLIGTAMVSLIGTAKVSLIGAAMVLGPPAVQNNSIICEKPLLH